MPKPKISVSKLVERAIGSLHKLMDAARKLDKNLGRLVSKTPYQNTNRQQIGSRMSKYLEGQHVNDSQDNIFNDMDDAGPSSMSSDRTGQNQGSNQSQNQPILHSPPVEESSTSFEGISDKQQLDEDFPNVIIFIDGKQFENAHSRRNSRQVEEFHNADASGEDPVQSSYINQLPDLNESSCEFVEQAIGMLHALMNLAESLEVNLKRLVPVSSLQLPKNTEENQIERANDDQSKTKVDDIDDINSKSLTKKRYATGSDKKCSVETPSQIQRQGKTQVHNSTKQESITSLQQNQRKLAPDPPCSVIYMEGKAFKDPYSRRLIQ